MQAKALLSFFYSSLGVSRAWPIDLLGLLGFFLVGLKAWQIGHQQSMNGQTGEVGGIQSKCLNWEHHTKKKIVKQSNSISYVFLLCSLPILIGKDWLKVITGIFHQPAVGEDSGV